MLQNKKINQITARFVILVMTVTMLASCSKSDDVDSYLEDTSGTPITILTQNMRVAYGEDNDRDGAENSAEMRKWRFYEMVKKWDPDIMGLQEVTPTWIDILEELFGGTYSIEYTYRASRSDEATPVMYKTEKYDLVDTGHFWLSDTPDVSSQSWDDTVVSRICTWVKLKDKATGVEFYIYSTHFGLGSLSELNGGLQMNRTLGALPKGTFAFMMGDLNHGYQDTTYMRWVDYINLIDTRDICQMLADEGAAEMGDLRNGTFNGFDHKNDDGTTFGDHIIAKSNVRMAVDYYTVDYTQYDSPEHGVEAGFVSDHFGVVCKARIATKASYQELYGDIG